MTTGLVTMNRLDGLNIHRHLRVATGTPSVYLYGMRERFLERVPSGFPHEEARGRAHSSMATEAPLPYKNRVDQSRARAEIVPTTSPLSITSESIGRG